MELKPKFEAVKSYYSKAKLEVWESPEKNKIYFLFSYGSLVCGITEETKGGKYIYFNNKILPNLLFSQTTTRHIKEFLKQFYEERDYTKKDLLKIGGLVNFDFLLYKDTNNGETIQPTNWESYYRATSPEAKKFFKGFDNYRERKTADTEGKYLFTKCKYGYSNYYYYYL